MPLDEEDADEEIASPYLSKADFLNGANGPKQFIK